MPLFRLTVMCGTMVICGTVHETMPVSTFTPWLSYSIAVICSVDNRLDSMKGLLMIAKYIQHKHR